MRGNGKEFREKEMKREERVWRSQTVAGEVASDGGGGVVVMGKERVEVLLKRRQWQGKTEKNKNKMLQNVKMHKNQAGVPKAVCYTAKL